METNNEPRQKVSKRGAIVLNTAKKSVPSMRMDLELAFFAPEIHFNVTNKFAKGMKPLRAK